ncbi:unnamed protein product [Mytilus edulis]|uniref:Reverse transcriptase n=1 Tax=Mytilus edulis TaxID=6550 RepID=A0A8S3TAQ7_MYTED|nr:unnamed protein product [Mytilus edulis]
MIITTCNSLHFNKDKDFNSNNNPTPNPYCLIVLLFGSKLKTRSGIGTLEKPDGTLASSTADKVEVLNQFFTSVFTQTEDLKDYDTNSVSNNFLNDINICQEDVLKKLNKLKTDKSAGPDGLHPKVLYVRNAICYPLFLIFNKSIIEGKVPDDWKNAIVSPIFKKGKKLKPVSSDYERCKLQENLDRLYEWSDIWKLKFNAAKCKVLHINPDNDLQYRYTILDESGNFLALSTVNEEKDLGVTFESNLKFEKHISDIYNKAQRVLSLIHHSFDYMDQDMFLTIYKSIVRPLLEYATCVWSPYLKKTSANWNLYKEGPQNW